LPAAFDIGTNSIRSLIGEVVDGRLQPLRYDRTITRLGGGYTPEQGLAPEAMARTLAVLRQLTTMLADLGVERVRAVGTQALRQAVNGPVFVREIKERLELTVEIIDGEEEARLSALGVRYALNPRPARCLIFDIGGGSTELVFYDNEQIRFGCSYPLGAVRLAEAGATDLSQIQTIIDHQLDQLMADLRAAELATALTQATFVGTAGTVTTMAAMDMEMVAYDQQKVNNYRIDLPRIETLLARLIPLSLAERKKLPGMETGREDLMVPGLMIVSSLLRRFSQTELTVSDYGLLEGVLLSMAEARAN